VIFQRPSDLRWQHAPLPPVTRRALREGHVLLVAIRGTHATILDKAYPRRPAPRGKAEWVGAHFVPIAAQGTPCFYAVLRDEPYPGRGKGELAREDPGLDDHRATRPGARSRELVGVHRQHGERARIWLYVRRRPRREDCRLGNHVVSWVRVSDMGGGALYRCDQCRAEFWYDTM
jgi:hypothetical protein